MISDCGFGKCPKRGLLLANASCGPSKGDSREAKMAIPGAREGRLRTTERFQTVSEMLNSGECEPAKAAVHALLMATAALCAAYNTAA